MHSTLFGVLLRRLLPVSFLTLLHRKNSAEGNPNMFLTEILFNPLVFCVLHIAVCYPCIFWATDAVPFFRTLQNHPLPLAIPYRREILISQTVSGVLVSLTFALTIKKQLIDNKIVLCASNMATSKHRLYLCRIYEEEELWIVLILHH